MDADAKVSVLYVDDEEPNLELFRLTAGPQFRVLTARSAAEGLRQLESNEVGVIVTDQVMPGMDGVEFLGQVYERFPNSVRIVVTAYQDVRLLLGAINAGHVSDYVLKPWEPAELKELLQRAADQYLRRHALELMCEERDYLADELRQRYDPSIIVGAEGGLSQVMETVRAVAGGEATVLLSGETGTGKELVARAIHAASLRRHRTFIKVDCGSLAPSLLESELFGHERGAFTGATRMRRGRFELADGGSLFLDEVSNLPINLQPKLLRVLQDRELERIGGGDTTLRVNVRTIAATNQDLERQVEAGTFRDDLFYRLNVVPVRLPPLRERLSDIDSLVSHFLRKHGGFRGEQIEVTAGAYEALRQHRWPGNVRELENVVERALLLAAGEERVFGPAAFGLDPAPPPPAASQQDLRESIRVSEREKLRTALVAAGGNVARAARSLGVARTTLRSRLTRHGLL